MTEPAPKPLADRIRDMAGRLKQMANSERSTWAVQGIALPMTLSYETEIPEISAIAAEIEKLAEEMRRESSGTIPYMDKWADSLTRETSNTEGGEIEHGQ
jgi:LPS sulfotransferase NodH